MTRTASSSPTFWRTVRLLLGIARKRAAGRRNRQRELLQNRTGKNSFDWGGVGFRLAILFMAILNVMAAFVLSAAVSAAERIEAERQGKIVVSSSFLEAAQETESAPDAADTADQSLDSSYYRSEARQIADEHGGDKPAIEQKLRDAMRHHGTRDFVTKDEVSPGLTGLPQAGRLTAMLGFLALAWWGAMLVFQGEGLELDLQRRRHPMWEWLFSHPVKPEAVFLAETLSPIAANPIYWGAPLFPAVLYGMIYGPGLGILAFFLIGIPITVAAACLGKALEIGVTLRFPPRTRGAVIGLMSWTGYTSMMLFFVGVALIPKLVATTGKYLVPVTLVPWPWLGLFLGQRDGSFSFVAGMIGNWIASGVIVFGAIWFSVWGAQQGLSGNLSAADSAPSLGRKSQVQFGRDPLYRKEFLWFVRDRSAIVQAILIPLTVAGYQLFNFNGMFSGTQGAWNYLCGAGILFGTYFLWILGPKSLTSEGPALWIALTWPRGLESLLKAKAWLWSLISLVMVFLVLCYAAFLFPASIWKIALVGIGWFFFGRSMAEKSVTLVSVTSSSGEREQISWSRRGAAQLGMLTFAIGVITQQWHLAIMGIVYSYLTAAAMWQNFRARLPYLYDPWSEKLPPPPTLMHAMISISILIEGVAVLTALLFGGAALAGAGRESIPMVQAISYGICSVIVSVVVWNFLSNRGVTSKDVWRWEAAKSSGPTSESWWRPTEIARTAFVRLLVIGAVAGLILGLFAHGYITALQHWPVTAEVLRKSQEQMAKIPDLKLWYAIMAVGFAPFAEEYLFRGLLFRALDREWGGWRAVVGSAAFFAIYHPVLSWLPVAVLGAANALLFKKTGRLAPAVALHMVYNAVVLM